MSIITDNLLASHGGTAPIEGVHVIVARPGDTPHRALLEHVAESGEWVEVREDQGTEWVPIEWVLPIEAKPAHTAAWCRQYESTLDERTLA